MVSASDSGDCDKSKQQTAFSGETWTLLFESFTDQSRIITVIVVVRDAIHQLTADSLVLVLSARITFSVTFSRDRVKQPKPAE